MEFDTDNTLDEEADDPLAVAEARVRQAEWRTRWISLGLTALFVVVVLSTGEGSLWEFVVFPAGGGTLYLFSVLSARRTRLMHVDAVRAQNARLMVRAMELEKMASHDELTQLYNRRYFYERMQEELDRARTSKQTLALITLDIDGLKKTNDEYGHAVGDIMISSLAKVIDKHIRTSDVPARLGGDEFAILMPDTDKRGAFSLAQRLWEELERTPVYAHDGESLMLNVSIGVSGYPWGGESIDEMMHWADADMYANKVSQRLPESALPARPQKLTDIPGLEDLDRL